MNSKRLRWFALGVALLAFAAPVRGQSFGFPWGKDATFQRELSLTAEQSDKIDAIFQGSISKLRQKKQDLDQLEEQLSNMVATNADEAAVIKQVDRVEAVRAHMNKMRTLMLLHERQVLTPEQRVKLNKMYEQRMKDQRNKPRIH